LPVDSSRAIHTTWNAYGLAVKGPLKGTQLKPLILIPEFWFAWSQFRLGTRLFSARRLDATELAETSVLPQRRSVQSR
jgi:hypothetical protein